MTKALLVIDMPSCCNVCTFNNAIGECKFVGNVDEALKHSLRYVKCPLKPMPEKSCYYNPFGSDVGYVKVNNAFIDGWNACLVEILGEEDDE